jgi:hypothetical protein
MHPEIEKLIDLALADGQITEKERNVIFKKAAELGVDTDEVEVILEAKIHQLNPKKKKIEDLNTCPSCGEIISGLSRTCICGYVINSNDIRNSKSLEEAIEILENLIVKIRAYGKNSSKSQLESFIAQIEKEVRYIKTRYQNNSEVSKLLKELEEISNTQIKSALKLNKRKRVKIATLGILIISLIAIIYGESFYTIYKKADDKKTFSNFIETKLDSIKNTKTKLYYKKFQYKIKNWDNFKEHYFYIYNEDGLTYHIKNLYRFNEDITYEIAENQFKNILEKFKNPIDFVLYNDKYAYLSLSETKKIDSLFISNLIGKEEWLIKKEIDKKINRIRGSELIKDELKVLNGGSNNSRALLSKWDTLAINNFLYKFDGTWPIQGYLNRILQNYNYITENQAEKYCLCVINKFKEKYDSPIDYIIWRANMTEEEYDKMRNLYDFCAKKNNFKLK